MATNTQRTEASRAALIEAGRALFGAHGFKDTSTPMIAKAAGVSRGALYHHFEDKTALFRAVVEAEFKRVEDKIDSFALQAKDPIEMLIEGGEAFIDAMSDETTRRLILIEAPHALSPEDMLSMDNATTSATLREGIEQAQKLGRLPADPPAAALTSMMSGAYDRAVLDGYGASEEGKLAIRHALRSVWFGLSRLA